MSVTALHIGKYYPPFQGGMENFLADLLPALQAQGVSCKALVHAHDRASVTESSQVAGVEVIRVPSYGRLLYVPVSPAFPVWLERAIARLRPDLLHLHLPNASALWALALPSARKIPWVVHWHSDVVPSRLDWRLRLAYPLYRPFEQALLSRARKIIVTSPAYLEASQPLARWRQKCVAVPLGLDESRYPMPTNEARLWADGQWGESRLRVLTVGRMTYYKGHETLIRAMADCPGHNLILVGGGERESALAALVARFGLAGQVKLIGRLPDDKMQALLASCDVFCLPSVERTEAFGMVLLEAMRYGRPLLVSDIEGSGVGWVVDAACGLKFEPGNVAELAAGLNRLAAGPALRESMAVEGRRRFECQFNIANVAEAVARVYSAL